MKDKSTRQMAHYFQKNLLPQNDKIAREFNPVLLIPHRITFFNIYWMSNLRTLKDKNLCKYQYKCDKLELKNWPFEMEIYHVWRPGGQILEDFCIIHVVSMNTSL